MAEKTETGPGYDAVRNGAAVARQPHRRFLGVSGRSPGEMLNGLLSNSPPAPLKARPPASSEKGTEGIRFGSAVYSTLLTAKGRIITDLRILRDLDDGFLLDLPSAGLEGALTHFRKFLPPRLAKVDDRSGEFDELSVFGPEAAAMLSEFLGTRGVVLSPETLSEVVEGEEFVVSPAADAIRILGSGETAAPGWDVLLSPGQADEAQAWLENAGVVPLAEADFELLRIERGRPVFGRDMDEDTIPVEAGIQGRAIDNDKGCYTGQEVIIRIRDRGQVNKALRGILLGDASPPPTGEELFLPGKEKSVGWVTSSVVSPAFGQTIALAYLRRAVTPGDDVRVGGQEGPAGLVRGLSDEGWILDRAEPD